MELQRPQRYEDWQPGEVATPNYEPVYQSPQRSEQPGGVGASPSSMVASPGARSVELFPQEKEEVIEYRFCSIFDSCLPEWVVDYLEEMCLSIYNYFAPLFNAGKMAPLEIGDAEDSLENKKKGLKIVTHITYVPVVNQPPVEPSAPTATTVGQGVIQFTATSAQHRNGYLLTGHGRLFRFTQELIRRQAVWQVNDMLEFERDELTVSNSTLCCTNKRTGAVWRVLPVASFDSPEKPGNQQIPAS
jgi:hypothetical protein